MVICCFILIFKVVQSLVTLLFPISIGFSIWKISFPLVLL